MRIKKNSIWIPLFCSNLSPSMCHNRIPSTYEIVNEEDLELGEFVDESWEFG